jgi:antitoxin CptB
MLARVRLRGNLRQGVFQGTRCRSAADISAARRYIPIARPRPGFWRSAAGEESMTARSSDGLDPRRRKLLFRCWHRGMREVDLIMGRFADAAVGALSDDELAEFERLIEVPDHDLLAWVTGEAGVPAAYDTPLFRRLRDFNRRGEGAS